MSQITKKALAASLKKLLNTKLLNQITINDITEDCGVNRMTFYYHFSDIYDLVEWICAQEAAEALADKKTYSTWQEGFLNIFQVVQDNKSFFTNVYHSVSREHMETYLYQLTFDLLMGVIEEQGVGMEVLEQDKQFIADFYKYAFVGILVNWVKDGMKEEPQKIIDRLSILVRGVIGRALEAFRRN